MIWQIYSDKTVKWNGNIIFTFSLKETFKNRQQEILWQLLRQVILCPTSIPRQRWPVWRVTQSKNSELLYVSQKVPEKWQKCMSEKWQKCMLLNDKRI